MMQRQLSKENLRSNVLRPPTMFASSTITAIMVSSPTQTSRHPAEHQTKPSHTVVSTPTIRMVSLKNASVTFEIQPVPCYFLHSTTGLTLSRRICGVSRCHMPPTFVGIPLERENNTHHYNVSVASTIRTPTSTIFIPSDARYTIWIPNYNPRIDSRTNGWSDHVWVSI